MNYGALTDGEFSGGAILQVDKEHDGATVSTKESCRDDL